MLADKPDLQFIPNQNITDHGSFVPSTPIVEGLCARMRQCTGRKLQALSQALVHEDLDIYFSGLIQRPHLDMRPSVVTSALYW